MIDAMAVAYQHQGCPKCGNKVPLELLRWETEHKCNACRTSFIGESFPALMRQQERGQRAESVADPSEASCFFHQGNRAANSCSACGRFVCALCSLDLPTGVVCPSCFNDGGLAAKAAPVLEKSRRIWSSIAMWVLVASGIFFWPSTLITAPVAGGMALYGLCRPGSLTGHGRWKNYVAFLLAMAVTAVWVWAIITADIWTWLK